MELPEVVRRKRLISVILVLSIALALFMANRNLQRIAVLGAFVVFNFLLAASKRFIPTSGVRKYFYGIEAVMLCTVFSSIYFGPKLGAVMGALLIAVTYIGERRFSRYFMITSTLYILIGYWAYYFRNVEIKVLGIAITLIYNLLVDIILMPFGTNKTTLLAFNFVNIIFNAFLFLSFGSLLAAVLG